jgi:hypothetical protein
VNRLRLRLLIALTSLYPQWWQQRYRTEFDAMLQTVVANRPNTPSLMLDITVGALDAHLFGQPPDGTVTRRRPVLLTATAGLTVSTVATLVTRARLEHLELWVGLTGLLLSAYAVRMAARSRPWTPPAGAVATGVMLAGLAGVLALAVGTVVRYPEIVGADVDAFSVVFAVIVLLHVMLALTPPGGLSDDRLAMRLGVAAGLCCGVWWTVIALTSPMTSEGLGHDTWPVGFLPPAVAFMVAMARGRMLSGAQAGMWAGLLASTLFFVTNMVTVLSLRSYPLTDPYDIAKYPHSGYTSTAAYLISDDLSGFIVYLALLPLMLTALSVLLGVLGAGLRQAVKP